MSFRNLRVNRLILSPIFVLVLFSTMLRAQETTPLRVVASFSILADVVQNVAGDTVQVQSLIPVGVDPHSFSPSPQDVVGIAEADIVFLNGAGLEGALLQTIENTGGDVNLVVVSECVEVLPLGEHEDDEHEDDEHEDDEHEDDEASDTSTIAEQCATHHAALESLIEADVDAADAADHEDEEHEHEMLYTLDCGTDETHDEDEEGEEAEEEHEHGACDPHVWTNPDNAILWVYTIRDTLSEYDAANAETYSRNADAYIAEILELNENTIRPLLESVPEDRRVLITNHETMGYFAETYGYRVAETVIPGNTTSSQLSAQDVVALIELIRAENIPAVFAENTVTSQVAEQVAAEGGAQFYTLLSDSLGTTAGSDSTYLEYLRYNAEIIVQALGGSTN